MIRQSDTQNDHALMELLRRPERPSKPAASAAPEPAGDVDLAIEIEIEIETARPCDDAEAAHDLAALRERRLLPERIRRLAYHVAACGSCKSLVASIVVEATPADSTGNHVPVIRTHRH
jgi:hypothetical protein